MAFVPFGDGDKSSGLNRIFHGAHQDHAALFGAERLLSVLIWRLRDPREGCTYHEFINFTVRILFWWGLLKLGNGGTRLRLFGG